MSSSYFNSTRVHSGDSPISKRDSMPKRKEIAHVFEPESLELFEYSGEKYKSRIAISGKKTSCQKVINLSKEYGTTYQHCVHFTLCDIELHNSYNALSCMHAVTKVFEKRQFGSGANNIKIRITDTKYADLYAMSRLVNNQGYELLEIGFCQKLKDKDIIRTHVMHVGYMYAFQNALLKAMSWIAPLQGVENFKER